MTRTTAAGPRRISPAVHYTVSSARLTMRNVSFVIFSVGMPVLLYVVFSKVFGAAAGTADYSSMIMISMAAYGALGAAMSGGAQLALERRSGWFRQLMITTLAPREFLWAKAAVIMIIVLPALLLVFTAGATLGGVRLPLTTWLASFLLMWVALIPMTMLGIVIGLWVKAETVQGVTTLVLLLMAMLGGLWFPAEFMPAAMQVVARALPSYWLAELGRWPILTGQAFPWVGVLVLLGWCAGLTVLGALGYRRAGATSKR